MPQRSAHRCANLPATINFRYFGSRCALRPGGGGAPSRGMATSTSQRVIARLAQTRKLLEQLQGHACLEVVSTSEASHVKELLDGKELSAADAAIVTKAVQDAKFGELALADVLWCLAENTKPEGGRHHVSVLKESKTGAGRVETEAIRAEPVGPELVAPAPVAPAVAPKAPGPARQSGGTWKAQNYESVIHYGTQGMWDQMKVTGQTEPLISIAMRLGLRYASAHTQQAIAVACMLHTRSTTACEEMDPGMRTRLVQAVGSAIKRKAKGLEQPSVHFATLPPTPVELWQMHPDVFFAVYGTDTAHHPVPCPVPSDTLEILRSSTRCRKPKADPWAPQAPLQLNVPPTQLPDEWKKVGTAMFAELKALQKQVAFLRCGDTPPQPSAPIAILDKAPEAVSSAASETTAPTWTFPAGCGAEAADSASVASAASGPAQAPASGKRARLTIAEASALVSEGYIDQRLKNHVAAPKDRGEGNSKRFQVVGGGGGMAVVTCPVSH